MLSGLIEFVVFPFNGGMECVADIFYRKYFLNDGYIVEAGGVDGDTKDRIAGRGSDGHCEKGVGIVETKVLVAKACHAHHQRGVELVFEVGVVGCLETNISRVVHLGFDIMARDHKQGRSKTEEDVFVHHIRNNVFKKKQYVAGLTEYS